MNKFEEAAKIFKAFCDPNREQCACKLLEQLNIGQPTLSHHMKILCDSGIINRVKYGKWTHYSINKEKLEDIKGIIDSMI